MSDATVVVFEKRPRWTPELQRQFAGKNVGVRTCHAIADVEVAPRESQRAAVILDLEAAPADVLRYLGNRSGRGFSPPAIVVATARWSELEWRVRELGAIEFLFGTVTGVEMAELCRRQWG
jgi:hypothetical protein